MFQTEGRGGSGNTVMMRIIGELMSSSLASGASSGSFLRSSLIRQPLLNRIGLTTYISLHAHA